MKNTKKMKNINSEDKSRSKERIERNDIEEDLDRFIEKREIQNEALKKIAGIKADSKLENPTISP